MPIDASIALGVKPAQFENPLNRLASILQVQQAQTQGDLAKYSLAKAQRGDEETNKLAQLLSGGGVDLSTPEGQAKAYSVAPTQAAGYIKGMLENRNTQAQIGERTAQTNKHTTDAVTARVAQYRDASGTVNDPASAAQLLQTMYADPALKGSAITAQPIENFLQHIPQDPAGFKTWQQQFALGAQKFIEMNKPNVHMQDTGGTSNVVSVPGLGGAPTLLSSTQKTQSPDNAATNATHIQTTGMTNAASRANNAATIQKDFTVAGISPNGGTSVDLQQMAKAVAEGKLSPPTGMALNHPRMQLLMNEVMKINPNFDATQYGAKAKAAKDFSTGSQGNAMRSFAVAGDHLDQLGQLVDALGNNNMQIVNKIGNTLSQQTGSPAVTNFDAAKDVVSKEVVKAIVAGGGGVAERQELAHLMDSVKSPAQLKGVIQQYRNLMAAQHDALLQQRDAAGLSRETLPNYTGGQHGAKPQGAWTYIGPVK